MSKLAELLESTKARRATAATPATSGIQRSRGSKSSRESVASLSPDLIRRIQLMAQRWNYTAAELTDVMARARRNPAAWLQAVTRDEQCEDEFRRRGLLPNADL